MGNLSKDNVGVPLAVTGQGVLALPLQLLIIVLLGTKQYTLRKGMKQSQLVIWKTSLQKKKVIPVTSTMKPEKLFELKLPQQLLMLLLKSKLFMQTLRIATIAVTMYSKSKTFTKSNLSLNLTLTLKL